jgi:mannose-6-phosphate isomerase-like protein (cupin superfamily)
MTVQQPTPKTAEAVSAPKRWFLSLPTWIRAGGGETNGTISLIEQVIPPGFASPWHVHHNEDESFLVVEGRLTVLVADRAITLNAGGFAFGPRGVPHGFRTEGTTPTRLILLTSGGTFADFIRATSLPADGASPPEPSEADIPKLIAAAQAHGLSILGPLPEF